MITVLPAREVKVGDYVLKEIPWGLEAEPHQFRHARLIKVTMANVIFDEALPRWGVETLDGERNMYEYETPLIVSRSS